MRPADLDLIRAIDFAFDSYAKPSTSTQAKTWNWESDDHDRILAARSRETLTREEIGGAGEVIGTCSTEAYAYWFPSLARFALAEPDSRWHWYAKILLFELTETRRGAELKDYVDERQAALVGRLLEAIPECRKDYLDEDEAREFRDAALHWK